MKSLHLIIFTLLVSFVYAQPAEDFADLKKHVEILASDEMEGRETGTKGEQMAADYIKKQFKLAGLTPKGDKGKFLQEFDVLAGKFYGKKNSLIVKGESLQAGIDFYALEFSCRLRYCIAG